MGFFEEREEITTNALQCHISRLLIHGALARWSRCTYPEAGGGNKLRSVSLTPTLYKLLERLIQRRLKFLPEHFE